jgi:hypothetical protein
VCKCTAGEEVTATNSCETPCEQTIETRNTDGLCVCVSTHEKVNNAGSCVVKCTNVEVRDTSSGDCRAAVCTDNVNSDDKTLTLPSGNCISDADCRSTNTL